MGVRLDVYFTQNRRVALSRAPINIRFSLLDHADHISLKCCSVLNTPRQCKIYASDPVRVFSLFLFLSLSSSRLSAPAIIIPLGWPRRMSQWKSPILIWLVSELAMVSLIEEMDRQSRLYFLSKWHRAFVFENIRLIVHYTHWTTIFPVSGITDVIYLNLPEIIVNVRCNFCETLRNQDLWKILRIIRDWNYFSEFVS